MELIRFRKNSDFIEVGNFAVGIYFRDRRAHCIRYESPLVQGAPGATGMTTSVHAISGIQVTTCRPTGSLHGPSQFGSNSLLFTPFMTV